MGELLCTSLAGKAINFAYRCFHFSAVVFLIVSFADLNGRYEKIVETQRWLSEEQGKLDAIKEASRIRHRRELSLDALQVLDRLKKTADMLEYRLNRTEAFKSAINSPISFLLPYLKGPVGSPGSPGTKGEKGDEGVAGRTGKTGPKGLKGVDYKHHFNYTGRNAYVRWGKKDCPNVADTEIVYSGFAAGQYYQHTGGMSNTVCLHPVPNFNKTSTADTGSHIYGVEYETSGFSHFSKLQNKDAPCAVCGVKSRGSHMMIPGRNVCPDGWTQEYKGYLLSAHYGHKGRASAVCVDDSAEGFLKSDKDNNGNLWYVAQGACGSLPCGPYVQGRELTCAVCTK